MIFIDMTCKIVNFNAMKGFNILMTLFITFCVSLTTMSAQTESSTGEEDKEEVSVFIPNAFTPNFDGLNDVFIPVIDGPELALYELVILDRSGREAFYSTDPKRVWNGSLNGNEYLTSPSMFVYFLKIQTVDGVSPLTYSGHVVLIR